MKYFHLIFLLLLGSVTSVQSAKILGVFTYPSFSHQNVYRQITKELSLRGHKVTVVTPNPAKDPTLTNLIEIDVNYVYQIFKKNEIQNKYSKDSPVDAMKSIYSVVDAVVELELNNSEFRKLFLDKNQKFDLILIHYFHPVMNGLGARYNAPVVSISTMNIPGSYYRSMGNPIYPALFPDLFSISRGGRLTLRQKFENLYFFLWQLYYHHWVFLPRTHQMATKYFGDIPYIGDLEKKISMLFVYRNILMDVPKPNVPAVIDFSFINLEPPSPLPDDLQKFLDEATEGVIYISFGSIVSVTLFEESLRNCILETLAELPYKVLLKWDSDNFPIKTSNIVARKWYPQRDILAHPNVKVFVTQGGVQSIEDAIFGAVPMVGIPFYVDQPKNVHRLMELGIGEKLDYNNIKRDEFKNAIIKVAENISYKEKIKTVRKILLDKTMTGLQSAVWWCEYVIRHKGGKNLRSPSVDISNIDYYLLDIPLILIFTFLTLYCTGMFLKLLKK